MGRAGPAELDQVCVDTFLMRGGNENGVWLVVLWRTTEEFLFGLMDYGAWFTEYCVVVRMLQRCSADAIVNAFQKFC